MAVYPINARHRIKRSLVTGATPTVTTGTPTDFTDGTWLDTDTRTGEFFFNVQDEKLWIGNLTGFNQVALIGSGDTYNNFCTSGLKTSSITGCSDYAAISFQGTQINLWSPQSGSGFSTTLSTEALKIQGSIYVPTGSNKSFGSVLLTAGTATVSNTLVTNSTLIFLTSQQDATSGSLRVSTRAAGVSFTITSTSGADTGRVAYQLIEPY